MPDMQDLGVEKVRTTTVTGKRRGRPPGPGKPRALRPPKPDTSHLAMSMREGSLASPALAAALHSTDYTPDQVSTFDLEAMKRKIIVMGYDRINWFLLSPRESLQAKAEMSIRIIPLIEGTRRVVEWDKRIPNERDLLARADRIAKQIKDAKDRIPAERLAQLQIEAASRIVQDLTDKSEEA